jgi:hypothetical protein
MKRSCSLILSLSLFLGMTSVAQESGPQPETVNIDIHHRFDRWIMSVPTPDDPSARDPSLTHSILLAVFRAVNPQSGQPYDNSDPSLDFDPDDLRHLFRLEKKEFLLGEPILVEHRIELNGPGKWNWFVGGNYRSRGRDDNFTFILRHADGEIVPDVYPKPGGLSLGGLGSDRTIEKGKPLSYWLGLQRYAAITEPGLYDLYCMTGYKQKVIGRIEAVRAALPPEVAQDHYVDDKGQLIDRETGQTSKRYQLSLNHLYPDTPRLWPLKGVIPPEVLAEASGQNSELPADDKWSFGAVAHFRIRIRKGTQAEQQQMVEQWTKTTETIKGRTGIGHYNEALLEAIWFSQQRHFTPLLEKWIMSVQGQSGFNSGLLHLDALAMRSDPAAFALLLKAKPLEIVNAFHRLHPGHITEAVPICIEWLSHAESEMRARAEVLLNNWTGQSFEHTWEGYHYQRPTLAEGQSMQRLWREWWERNKSGFKPRKPCPFPCEKTEN